MAWAVPKQCCGTIEKIIGFLVKQFYADAIEPAHSVKVRVILGPIQMRTGQYTLRQMSQPIYFFCLTEECVCTCASESLLRVGPFYVEQMKKSLGC